MRIRLYRVALAALVIAAIVAQLDTSLGNGLSAANFFSFFTIQNNLLAAAVFLWGAVAPAAVPSRFRDSLRGATTLFMAITGVVFALLLSGYQEELQTTTPWVNTVVHEVMPLAVVLDWLLDPPRTKLGLRDAATWLLYPLAYLLYTQLRGPIAGWYPYPFLDPGIDGAGSVVAHCAGILVAMVVVGYSVVAIGNWRSGRAERLPG